MNAQDHLGECYLIGRSIAKDEAEAEKWLRKAAEQGCAGAQRILKQLGM